MNLIDKAIAVVSPEKALKRAGARKRLEIVNSGYSQHGASYHKSSTRGWFADSGASKEDIEDNLQTLWARSKDAYMGIPIATGAIKTMRTHVVGSGLTLKSQIDYQTLGISNEQALELEYKIEREFNLWAGKTACDLERMDNFNGLQQLAFINWLLCGDVIALLPTTERVNSPYDLRIQLIEADRVETPQEKLNDENFICGVEQNNAGEVIAYHIRNTHPQSSSMKPVKWTRVEAYGKVTGRRNVLHVMNRERIGQRRGVPFLAPVLEAIKQMGRYTEAELVAAVVSGYFSVFIQKKGPNAEGIMEGSYIPESEQIAANEENTLELAPGAIIDLGEGEEANPVSPGRPNSNFDGFVVAISRQIGAALEIPHEILLKEFNSSFSASRGALLEAWMMFKMYRNWLAEDFCQPIYEEWLAEAVAKGRIIAPGFFADPAIQNAYSRASWHGPAQGLLNPSQEVAAAAARVANGFSTGEREAREMNGSDFHQNIVQRKQEIKLLKEVEDIANPNNSGSNTGGNSK